jgi:superfamily I DNA/RNA helicase
MAVGEHDEIAALRSAATDAIVHSEADKKLIVAGPGTGKTFTFRRALEACESRGLALTFIRNLVADLQAALDDVADVFTFHGFCKYQLHRHPVDGLEEGWHYYPPLLKLLAHDLSLAGRQWNERDLSLALHSLDHSDDEIAEVMRLGEYFNAVSHTDVVYRVLQHFEQRRDQLPTYALIVVDEYQDFSALETEFIQLLATESKVLIAGDDDQALYGFKGADPAYIRELATAGEFVRFALPYCSRCTDVVVKSVRDVLERAVEHGNLAERLEKDFECYTPDKAADSEAHPLIIHAACSVQSNRAPYVGRYIVEQIQQIPEEDIAESIAESYPTVLVIGPQPFLGAAFATIQERFPQAVLRTASSVDVELLDGYRMIAIDEESRLGWRIVIECDPFPGFADVLIEVTRDEAELFDLLPYEYRDRHLVLVDLVRRLLDDGELGAAEKEALQTGLNLAWDQISDALALAEKRDDEEPEDLGDEPSNPEGGGTEEPTVVCTSLTGSKGLSAGHVFIVGFNDGHFPRGPGAITDQEVCQFLVGLSRTRKQCHVVSAGRYGTSWLKPSRFATWIKDSLDEIAVDKKYFDG